MPTVGDVLRVLEEIAPARFAFSFDKIGLQIGSPDQPVSRAVVSLDRSLGAISFAREQGAQLLLSHHPLIWDPLKRVLLNQHVGRSVAELLKADIAFIAAHTNWDSARHGINDALASVLGLEEVSDFGTASEVPMLKLVVFTPAEAVDAVIDAASAAGAGRIGNYERCAFTSEGHGTFLGNDEANPTVGEKGRIEVVPEVKIEMVLPQERATAVEKAVRTAHPYEAPAFDLLPMRNLHEQPAGRMGVLAQPMSLREFVTHVDARLETRSEAWGDPEKRVRKIAVVGGAADGDWVSARNQGADVYLTGEVKQNVALEASESGIAILASGHYATEQPGCEALRETMAQRLREIDWGLFTPAPGLHGRPFTR